MLVLSFWTSITSFKIFFLFSLNLFLKTKEGSLEEKLFMENIAVKNVSQHTKHASILKNGIHGLLLHNLMTV